MFIAIIVLEKVNIKRFKEETSIKMETLMIAELD